MSKQSTRRAVTILGAGLAATMLGGPAFAGHVHYVMTPNGACHQVGSGQTSIEDVDHGGYHQFHDHVHIGATGDDHLGNGHAAVAVYKAGPAPAVCDGD